MDGLKIKNPETPPPLALLMGRSKKGPGDGPPGPNNRASRGVMFPERSPENNVCRVAQLQRRKWLPQCLLLDRPNSLRRAIIEIADSLHAPLDCLTVPH
jgi:hypothetical protein